MKTRCPETDNCFPWSLQRSINELSTGCNDDRTEAAILQIAENAELDATSAHQALIAIQRIIESFRSIPDGLERITRMNTFVRTLGRADRLSKFLDMLRACVSVEDPDANKLAQLSVMDSMHCIYGWAGQTLMLGTQRNATQGTTPADPGVEDYFEFAVPQWHLSIHIWQPNPNAVAFESTKRIEPGVIVEPPHSHPFPFVSYLAIGEMRQSIYVEDSGPPGGGPGQRYDGVPLERVTGIWPPHQEYRQTRLWAAEERVHLEVGQSYNMPTDVLHDVEVVRQVAARTPAITLFLAAETTSLPSAYLVPAMAEFHRDNPRVREVATALTPSEWDAKLRASASYLRGDASELRLDQIFECNSSYAFMNA